MINRLLEPFQVSARIREELIKRAGEFNILLEDVSLTHLTFGREFTKAVEEKQIAQQDAERAKFIVEKVIIGYNLKMIECA